MNGRLEIVCGYIRLLDSRLYNMLIRASARRVAENNLYVGLSLVCDLMAWSLPDMRAWLTATNTPVWTCVGEIPELFVACKAVMSAENLLRDLDCRPAVELHASDLSWATNQSGAVVTGGGCIDSLERCKLTPVEIDSILERDIMAVGGSRGDTETSPTRVYAELDALLLGDEPELVTSIVESVIRDTCPDRILVLLSTLLWLHDSVLAPPPDRHLIKNIPGRFFSSKRLDEPYVTGPLSDLDQEWLYSACRLSDLGDAWEPACRAILMNAAGQGNMQIAVGREWPVRTSVGRFGWSNDAVCVINHLKGAVETSLDAGTAATIYSQPS